MLTPIFYSITPAEDVAKSGDGTLSFYVLAKPSMMVKKPANVSFADAASFPLAGLTAWMALVDNGGLKMGETGKKVFINGGTSGVGAWGIQVCALFQSHKRLLMIELDCKSPWSQSNSFLFWRINESC